MTTYASGYSVREIDRRPVDPPALRLGVALGALAAGIVLLFVVLFATDTFSFASRGAHSTVEQVRSGGTTGDSLEQLDATLAELGQ